MSDDDKVRHDFKNQLAIIRGFAEIVLAEIADNDPRRHDLEEIHRAAVSALGLLDRLYPERTAPLSQFPVRPSGIADK
jgi:signal transduction histidine kinase